MSDDGNGKRKGEAEATDQKKSDVRKEEAKPGDRPAATPPAGKAPEKPPTPKPTQATPPVMRPSGAPEQPTLPAKEGALPEPRQPTGQEVAKAAGEEPPASAKPGAPPGAPSAAPAATAKPADAAPGAKPAAAAPGAKPTAAAKPAAKAVAWPFPAMHAEPTDTEDVEALEKAVEGAVEKRGMDATHKPVVYVKPDRLWDVANHAATALGFDHLACLTAIDYPAQGKFDVTYNLYSYPRGRHLVLKVLVARDKAEVRSVTSIWRGANWHEREVWDMFGIRFAGHPDLRRIFLPEGWRGFPLRKDYDMKEQYIGMDDETGEDVVYDEPGEYRW